MEELNIADSIDLRFDAAPSEPQNHEVAEFFIVINTMGFQKFLNWEILVTISKLQILNMC